MASKLSIRDKQLLDTGRKFKPGTKKYEGGLFGSQLADLMGSEDFVLLSVVEPSTDRVITTKEIPPITEGENIIVKPGIDLRGMGFVSGRFKFKYEFYRRLAGNDQVVLIRTDEGNEGVIYDGPFYINAQNEYKSGGPNQPDSFNLKPTKLNYEIKEIGGSRQEVKIRARNINDDIYKEAFFDRQFAFKNIIVNNEYRELTGRNPEVRFFNPFNPDMSSPSNVGFGAHSGGPPQDDDPSSTHLILEQGAGFRFKEIMEGGTIRIKNAYQIGEREEILVTDSNIVNNPSGDQVMFGDDLKPQKPIGVFDDDLHSDAVMTEAWSSGILGFNSPFDPHYGTAATGYHAKWVNGEGRNGGACIKFIDKNAIYRNDTIWPTNNGEKATVHRPLVISTSLPAISNYGVTPGQDLFYISYFQKSSVLEKGATITLKYGAGFGAGEPRPQTPPDGYHVPGTDVGDVPDSFPQGYLAEPTEQRPSGEVTGNDGEGLLSPNKQWYVSSIQNGLYVWEVNYDTYNIEDGSTEGIVGIRKVNSLTTTDGSDGTQRNWIWRGSTWTPEIPPDIPGCTNPAALNYQSYADTDDGSCTFQQSVLPESSNFDVVFKCRHQEYFDGTPWDTFSGAHATFFLKYDDTLQDYHIWQSRFGGAENSVQYRFGIAQMFGNANQSDNHQLGESNVIVKKDGSKIGFSVDETNPGLIALMTRYGKIKDVAEYHRYGSGYSNKKKVLIIFVSFNQDYRDFLESNGASEDQAQGIVVEYNSEGNKIEQIEFFADETKQENSVGTLDEMPHSVFEDRGNKPDPRYWLLPTTGTPARVKTAGGSRIIDPYKNNDDYFEYWIGNGLGTFTSIYGDDSSEKYVGISEDQVYATELSATADGLPGYPKPISEVFPGVGVKDLYIQYGCANPFANNYGEISEGDAAGTNPLQALKEQINNFEVGATLQFGGGLVKIVSENANERLPNFPSRVFLEQRKSTLIRKLNSPDLNLRRRQNIPNVDGGNCDFSVSNDPLRNGTMSPNGFWKWNGPDAVWEYQGDSPAAITYKAIELSGVTNSTENQWEQFEGSAPIPEDILTNTPMELVIEGHVVGGSDGGNKQGIVWVDDFDLRFQKPNETSTQGIFADYNGTIINVEGDDILKLDKSFDQVGDELGALSTPYNNQRTDVTRGGLPGDTTRAYTEFEIRYRVNDAEELRTYVDVRGKKYLTTNFKQDAITEPLYPHALVYKLYNKLDANVSKFDGIKIVKEMMMPYEDTIDLVDYVPSEIRGTVLLSPKLEDSDSPVRARATTFKTESDIVTTNTEIKEKLQDMILSGSTEEVEMNIPYEKGFRGFVHFSSAKKRVENFKYKLELIESYAQSSASSATLTQAPMYKEKTQVKIWHDKIREVKNSFDGFENYMYYQSSSFFTSSMGTFYDNAWPKLSGAGTMTSPYVLAHTTSSEGAAWLNRQIASGSEYDSRNGSYLINNTPQFVTEDASNAAYLDFIKMTGHYFDKIYQFIKQMGNINDRRESITEGLSKQLYYSVAKSLGWSLQDGKDLVDLPNFLLGQSADSGSSETFTEIEKTEQDISREIWSRIVSNMPYFLKTKGTIRAFKGLINCYGIPSSILRVREYGGPDTPSSVNYAIDRKFTKSLGFDGGQQVSFKWQVASASVAGDTPGFPDAVEFRFRAPTSRNQLIWNKGNNFGVLMKDNGSADNIGSVCFFLSGSGGMKAVSSSNIPIYDNEFYSAMIRRTTHSASLDVAVDYNLVVKKYDAGIDRFQYVSDTTLSIDGTNAAGKTFNQSWQTPGSFSIGGSGTITGALTGSLDFNQQPIQRFSGSLMEFRIWTEVLSTASFDNHVANPKAYNGNNISSSYEHIVSRYSFDDDKDLSSDTSIADVSAKTTETQNGTAVGFTANTFQNVVDRTKSLQPNLGPSRQTSTKIRLENNIVRPEFKFQSGSEGQTIELQSETRISRGTHDFASRDSNKVGIYFSPSDAINQDIIESLANINFDNFLGDPRDRYEETYRGLDAAQDKYWLKYNAPFNFWQYLKLLKTYDQSIFPQLKKLTPARANARFGILIEPNILERAREIVGKQPSFQNTYYEDRIIMTGSYSSSADFKVYGQQYAPSTDTSFDEINQAIQYYTNDPSSSALVIRGESKYFEGSMTQSRLENFEHTVWERQGTPGDIYASASVTYGDSFKDNLPLQPFISGSRVNPLRSKINLFYSSVLSASNDAPSSFSYEPSTINVPADSSTAMRRLFFEGVKNTKLTTQDGLEPVEVTLTTPTRIITKEPGDSKLDIE